MDIKRIYAWIIDFVIICIIQALLTGILIIKLALGSTESFDYSTFFLRYLILTYCSMLLLIIRDIIGKKSVGKRIFRLKIVDKDTGAEVNKIKKFLRNVTWLLGPIEVIVYLITKERLGDKITRTSVVLEEHKVENVKILTKSP